MSFKSKQRAKHSHLFGDDTQNATTKSNASTTPETSDIHRSSSNQSRSPLDPLSRSSSPGASNNDSNTNSSPNGSIFGGVDVSKFSSKLNNGRSATSSTRPNPTLKVVDGGDSSNDDSDYLFGGGRKSAASTNLESRKSSTNSVSSSTSTSPIMTAKAVPTGSVRTPIPLSSPSINSTAPQDSDQHTHSLSTSISRVESTSSIGSSRSQTKHMDVLSTTKKQTPPPPVRRPASISKSAISSLVSSSTSSILFVSSSRSSSPIMAKSQLVPPPPPPRTHKKHQQQQQQDVLKQIEPSVEDDVNERMMQQQKAAMMEDEATRAFAMEPTSHLIPNLANMNMDYDDPELYASVTQFHSLAITGSSSTPIHKSQPLDDHQTSHAATASSTTNPWDSTTTSFLTPTAGTGTSFMPPHPIATTTTPLPSSSSSVAATAKNQQRELDGKLKELEPAKRAAFADLIADWHGGSNKHRNNSSSNEDNNDQFLRYVASEQRDVGFAGINGQTVRDNDLDATTSFDWQQGSLLDDNPWS